MLTRIKKLADNENITIGLLERKIGSSKGVLSRAINNGTDIHAKWLQAIIENYPGYSASWLLTGEGSMVVQESVTVEKLPSCQDQDNPENCPACRQKDQRIADLLEMIASLKETNTVQKELIAELRRQ